MGKRSLTSSTDLRLVKPSLAYEAQILAYREECLKADGHPLIGVGDLDEGGFPAWLEMADKKSRPDTCPEGQVPNSQFLCVRTADDHMVGMLNIRHYLNDYLRDFGGHVGYAIRPSERGKGYAIQQLTLGLKECVRMGINPVLVMCYSDNERSRRTILKGGGIYEDTREREDGKRFERYWINLTE